MRIAIFGPGGMGRETVRLARLAHREMTGADDPGGVVFVSDEPGGEVAGIEVIGADSLRAEDRLVVALGDSEARRAVAGRLGHVRPISLIAPTAVIGPDVEIGEGALICDFSTVTASVTIGRHFQCNIHCHVSHDCRIGDFVTFAPRAGCNGTVRIEDGAYIGSGAIIRQGRPDSPMVIGAGATVGMGAVVTRSVPAGVTVVGNPARPMERR
jgi:sugar O-acyltransferase (sialic acid O-acetyltransferase NeuD family)